MAEQHPSDLMPQWEVGKPVSGRAPIHLLVLSLPLHMALPSGESDFHGGSNSTVKRKIFLIYKYKQTKTIQNKRIEISL